MSSGISPFKIASYYSSYSLGAGPVRGPRPEQRPLPVEIAVVRNYMTDKISSAIKCPEMIAFIQKLIAHLSERKKFKEVVKLQSIVEGFSSENFDQLNVLRLSVLNDKNPLICSLICLDRRTIESLKAISLPDFFPDFFEKLEFYANIQKLSGMSSDPEEEIANLIPFANSLIRSGKKKEASIVLGNIRIAMRDRNLGLDRAKKVETFRRVASSFFDMKDRENGVAALTEALSRVCRHSYSSSNQQIADLADLAKDFSFAKSWNEVIYIINLIGRTEHFPSKQRISAFIEIFKYIATHEEESMVWDIFKHSARFPEKNIAIEQLQQIALGM